MTRERPLLPIAALIATAALALVLVVSLQPEADGEKINVYEFEELSTDYGGNAVAVRDDGMESIVLWSERNTTTGRYTNYVLSTNGMTITEQQKVPDVNWYWRCAAYKPDRNLALLGGSRGRLCTYNSGTITQVSTGINDDINDIVWYPTGSWALLGTSYGRLYRYSSGSVSFVDSTNNRIEDMDIKGDGTMVVISAYNSFYTFNTAFDDLQRIDSPDDEDYYYCYCAEFNPSDTYALTCWYNWDEYALYLWTHKWEKAGRAMNAVRRVEYEVEGTFALLALDNNLQYVQGTTIGAVTDWYAAGGSGVQDIAYNDDDFYFLIGTPDSLWKFKRKANVRPWLENPIPDLEFNEDDPEGGNDLLNLNAYIRDDRDIRKLRFEFDFQQNTSLVEGRIDGHFVDFIQKVPHWNGKLSFGIRVYDRGFDDIEGTLDDKSNTTNTFYVTVKPMNDPITLISIGDEIVGVDDLVFITDEGEWLNLSIVTSDVDEEPSLYSTNRSLPTLKINPVTGLLSFRPRNKDVGTHFLNLTVSDGQGSFDYAHLIIDVKNVNNPPKLMDVKDRTVMEDTWLNFTVWARDEDLEIGMANVLTFATNRSDGAGDDDLETFSVNYDPEDPTYIHVSFLPKNEHVGELDVEFRVRDNIAPPGTWQDRRTMTITVENTNDAPVLTELNGVDLTGVSKYALLATEDLELVFDLAAHDDDRDPLIYYVDDHRFHVDQGYLAVTATVSITPTNDDVGTIDLTVSVWDDHNSFDELFVTITIENENDPPVILAFEAQDVTGLSSLEFTVYEDIMFTAPITVRDIDSERIIFSDSESILIIETDPDDPFRAVATFTPRQADVGQLSTTLEVDDTDEGKDLLAIVFHVLDTNDPPKGLEMEQLGGEASLTIKFRASASDAEGDELNYTWSFGDHTADVSGENLREVEHRYPKSGSYTLTLTVTDGRGGRTVAHFDVSVPMVEDDLDPVEVEEGPVLPVAIVTAIFAIIAVAVIYMYWTSPRRRGG